MNKSLFADETVERYGEIEYRAW